MLPRMLLQSKRLFIYMVYLQCFTNILKCQKYEKLQGYVFSTGTMLWSDDDPLSVIQCIAVCKMTVNCYAISITYPAGICAYYDWYLGSSAAVSMTFGSENDYIVFVKPISGTVLHFYLHAIWQRFESFFLSFFVSERSYTR